MGHGTGEPGEGSNGYQPEQAETQRSILDGVTVDARTRDEAGERYKGYMDYSSALARVPADLLVERLESDFEDGGVPDDQERAAILCVVAAKRYEHRGLGDVENVDEIFKLTQYAASLQRLVTNS